jgi:hypothetical protein
MNLKTDELTGAAAGVNDEFTNDERRRRMAAVNRKTVMTDGENPQASKLLQPEKRQIPSFKRLSVGVLGWPRFKAPAVRAKFVAARQTPPRPGIDS